MNNWRQLSKNIQTHTLEYFQRLKRFRQSDKELIQGIDAALEVLEINRGYEDDSYHKWLNDHEYCKPYIGRYVAVHEDVGIVASGDNFNDVRKELLAKKISDTRSLLFAYVDDPEVAFMGGAFLFGEPENDE